MKQITHFFLEGESPALIISQGNNFKTCLRIQAPENWTTFTFSWCSWVTISLIYTLLLLNENPKRKLTDYLRNLMSARTTNLRFSDVFREHRDVTLTENRLIKSFIAATCSINSNFSIIKPLAFLSKL